MASPAHAHADRGVLSRWWGRRQLRRRYLLALIALAFVPLEAGTPNVLHAEPSPFKALADHLTTPRTAPYRGPTRPFPDAIAQPRRGALHAVSSRLPLAVYARPLAGTGRVLRTLLALERAYDWLSASGYPLPCGDIENETELAVHVVPELSGGAGAGVLAPIASSALDAASTFGLLAEGLDDDELDRCALAALAEAGLLGNDPAEPRELLRAAARVAVWTAHGELGCEPDAARMQQNAALGPLGESEAQVDNAALWLTRMLERHDPSGITLLPGLFAAARQRSSSPNALHARPNAWQALSQVLERTGETLDDAAIELAVDRMLLPGHAGDAFGLSATTQVPWMAQAALRALPKSAEPLEPLATYGSAYARIDTKDARAGDQLRVWLRTQLGPRWSLVGSRLDAEGEEIGRVTAPPRNTAGNFLPVELDARTRSVVLVVTKLPRWSIADGISAYDEHEFRLTVDVARAK